MLRRFIGVIAAVACGWLFTLTASAQVKFYVTDTGDFSPQAVSPDGLIAGGLTLHINNGTTSVNQFLATYTTGHLHVIGAVSPVGANDTLFNLSVVSVSDNGTIALAGSSFKYGNATAVYDGAAHLIPDIYNASTVPGSWGANASGYVAGRLPFLGNPSLGSFTFSNGAKTLVTQTTIGPPNKLGQSAAYQVPDPRLPALFGIYQNGAFTKTIDNSVVPSLSNLTEINDNGEFLGSYLDDSHAQQSVLIQNGTPTYISTQVFGQTTSLISLANNGTAAGNISFPETTEDPSYSHAAYFDGTTLHDLNDLIDPTTGWTLTKAVGISDTGLIIGRGTHNGVDAGFVLTPMPPVMEPLPEPIAGAFLGAAALLMARKRTA